MAWAAAAKAGVQLAAEAAATAGVEELVRRQINKYFPDATDQQLADIKRQLNGIYGLLLDGPFPNSEPEKGQCNTQYKVRFSATWKNSSNSQRGPFEYDFTVDGPFTGPLERIRPNGDLVVYYVTESGRETDMAGFPQHSGIRDFQKTPYDISRIDGLPDNCGAQPAPNFPDGPVPPEIPGNFDGQPGNTKFGTPYFDEDGNLRFPFKIEADDGSWTLEGSHNPATGETNFGETVDEDGDGIPDYDKKYPPGDGTGGGGGGAGNDDCVKLRICGETDSETNSWPITVPELLTQSDNATYDITSLPQAIAWFARNIDAISGQYPITLEIEDTDPITRGNQSQTINLPNQAEAMAELFGLAYEANTNSELMVNMLFRLIPEVIAAKNSSLTSQDYTQAITNWLGFRTKNVQREIDSNFNPLSPESLIDFLGASKYKIQGVEDDDPHTLVEWVQQFKYAAGLVKASLFRGADLEGQLSAEMEEVINNQPEDSAEAWEKFIDALNRAESNLTDRTVAPRPRATSVDDVLNIGTVLPGPDPD